MDKEQPEGDSRQRIDKWLFFARLARSRSIAQAQVSSGHVKVNDSAAGQPSRLVRPGDRLEIQQKNRSLLLVVKAIGARRGPYEEARLLYEDITPEEEARPVASRYEQALRAPGSGRPTKKERRALDRMQGLGSEEED